MPCWIQIAGTRDALLDSRPIRSAREHVHEIDFSGTSASLA
jgi:hypothetical protein